MNAFRSLKITAFAISAGCSATSLMAVATPDGNGAAGEPLIWSRSSALTAIVPLAAHRASQHSSLHYARVTVRRGFAVRATRFSAKRVRKGKTGAPTIAATIRASNGTFQKYPYKTISYRESSITSACYLCNIHRKRRRVRRFEVVPLLRVQKSSVIVMTRRRGASRGRPVRWFA